MDDGELHSILESAQAEKARADAATQVAGRPPLVKPRAPIDAARFEQMPVSENFEDRRHSWTVGQALGLPHSKLLIESIKHPLTRITDLEEMAYPKDKTDYDSQMAADLGANKIGAGSPILRAANESVGGYSRDLEPYLEQ